MLSSKCYAILEMRLLLTIKNYIVWLLRREINGIFQVYLRLALIFTDFPTGSGSQACALLEICEYQEHP